MASLSIYPCRITQIVKTCIKLPGHKQIRNRMGVQKGGIEVKELKKCYSLSQCFLGWSVQRLTISKYSGVINDLSSFLAVPHVPRETNASRIRTISEECDREKRRFILKT